jgi:hypothetical protein
MVVDLTGGPHHHGGRGISDFRVALGILHEKVVGALGLESEIHDIQVGWTGVDIVGLRIKGINK